MELTLSANTTQDIIIVKPYVHTFTEGTVSTLTDYTIGDIRLSTTLQPLIDSGDIVLLFGDRVVVNVGALGIIDVVAFGL
jgi:hypothetical protein